MAQWHGRLFVCLFLHLHSPSMVEVLAHDLLLHYCYYCHRLASTAHAESERARPGRRRQ
jgi:hypothetical protein